MPGTSVSEKIQKALEKAFGIKRSDPYFKRVLSPRSAVVPKKKKGARK